MSANPHQYAYRADGLRTRLALNNGTSFSWQYTAAGRQVAQADPLTGTTITPGAYYTVGKSTTQQPIYPASLTYAARQQSFDTYGRIQSVVLPNTLFSYPSIVHDLEDGISTQTAQSVQNPGTSSYASCFRKNVRNEIPPMNYLCTAPYATPEMLNGSALGLYPTIDGTGNTQLVGVADWTLDARAGMLKSWQATAQDGNPVGSQYTYDASGRLTQDNEQLNRPWQASDGGTAGDYVYLTGTRSKSYDAENRLRTETKSADPSESTAPTASRPAAGTGATRPASRRSTTDPTATPCASAWSTTRPPRCSRRPP